MIHGLQLRGRTFHHHPHRAHIHRKCTKKNGTPRSFGLTEAGNTKGSMIRAQVVIGWPTPGRAWPLICKSVALLLIVQHSAIEDPLLQRRLLPLYLLDCAAGDEESFMVTECRRPNLINDRCMLAQTDAYISTANGAALGVVWTVRVPLRHGVLWRRFRCEKHNRRLSKAPLSYVEHESRTSFCFGSISSPLCSAEYLHSRVVRVGPVETIPSN